MTEIKDGRPFYGEDLQRPQMIVQECHRCGHKWLEECSIDGGPSPAWIPLRHPLTCPSCGKNPWMSFREKHPDAPEFEKLEDWWEWCLDQAMRDSMPKIFADQFENAAHDHATR